VLDCSHHNREEAMGTISEVAASTSLGCGPGREAGPGSIAGMQSRSREAHFREVLSAVPTSVAVMTAIHGGEPVGLTVGSFTAVSLQPQLVGFLPAASSTTFPRLREAGAFCANILAAEQEQVCRSFAVSGSDKFVGLSWHSAPMTGSPVLRGVAAWIDCRIAAVYEAGDHFFVIGQVMALEAQAGATPLLFHRGDFTRPESTD
jgi:flavin reductase (DIM6/NTAB) family NADH-FMN oxidoreductase RutF